MSTVTVGPRVEFDVSRYIRIRAYSRRHEADRYVQLHRLVAWAHGELDSPFVEDDRRHADHLNGDKWDNRPSNLTGRMPDEHGRRHRRQQLES